MAVGGTGVTVAVTETAVATPGVTTDAVVEVTVGMAVGDKIVMEVEN